VIGIIDYGLGNIRAFSNIFKKLNIEHKIVSKADDLKDVTKIILPGVGAFDHAMKCLNGSGMREMLDQMVSEENIPVLGICVGMQMLAHSSDEGNEKGLGWIDGEVKKFDASKLTNREPLPHMGWNTVFPLKKIKLIESLGESPRFYFLHSYYFVCNNSDDIVSTTEYGEKFSSIVNSKNVYGIQCHPEKSHSNGVQLLKNFGEL